MMRNLKLALAMLAVAAFAFGQNAGKNTAGPTANDYKLQVIEPSEGAAITGRNVQVIVDLNSRQQLANQEKPDGNSMPQARVTVFLDNTLKGTLHDQHNVLNIENVTPGPHRLVLEARNLSGEVIDHKEVNFVSTEATTASNATSAPAGSTMGHARTAEPSSSAAYPPAETSSPAPSASSPSSSAAGSSSRERTLPQTGSSAPLLAVAGLGLLGLGLAVRSKV